jgi:pilus assembly protein CpaD
MTKTNLLRPAVAALALGLSLAAAPAIARDVERGVEPAHQPVVARTDFVFDVTPDGSGGLSGAEQSRLSTWFKALGLRYGDHVTIAGKSSYTPRALQDGVAEVVGAYGLLVEGEAPATAGEAPAGGLRVVVSRSVASVPNCPTWRDKAEANLTGGLSDNYGCASASNLAAMIADPNDLVDGRSAGVNPSSTVGGKAIQTYKEKAPTGAGGLQSMGVN